MKILVVNYRYFVSGGPERYMFNVIDLLEARGHEVVPFSIQYERNEPTPYEQYFAPPLGDASEVYFRDHKKSLGTVTKSIERAFYSRDVYRRLASLIEAERPDAALVLHYLRKLSPSVVKCLHDHRVPFAVRISDFGMVCPNAHLFRDGGPCELCVTGSLRHSVKYRCVQGSLGASAVNYAATRFHQAAGYYDLIETFLVPSRFTLAKMEEGGIARERLVHLPTFVTEKPKLGAPLRGSDVVYVGRLDELKGAHLLLEAVRMLNERTEIPRIRVRVIGTGDPGYVDELKAFAQEHNLANVTFEGALPEAEVRAALRSARCAVAPSLWYDNMPNAVLESLAEGTPVVAPRHGCFPEIVRDGETGLLVNPNDPASLADGIARLASDASLAADLGNRGREFVKTEHSAEGHYERLIGALAP